MALAQKSKRAVLRQSSAGLPDQLLATTPYTWLHACAHNARAQGFGVAATGCIPVGDPLPKWVI